MIKTVGIINSKGEFKPLVRVHNDEEIKYYREMWESQGYKVETR